MNLTVTGLNLDVTEALREYISNKLTRINRHSDSIISTSVTLCTVEKSKHKVEADVHLAGKDLHVETTEDDMYAAIDVLMDKLDRMILKHKEKNTQHRATPSGRESVAQQAE